MNSIYETGYLPVGVVIQLIGCMVAAPMLYDMLMSILFSIGIGGDDDDDMSGLT